MLIKSLKEGPGLPDILVNNAGITVDKLLIRMNNDDWDQVIDTNLSAIYRMSKACIRGMMKARSGRIINVGSVIGSMGNAGQSNYAAAKAGLIGFSKALAQEVGGRGITVNVVAPGYIQTDMTAELPADQKELLLDKIPLQKLGETEDIAQAVLFLASESGRYITGETLHVNGGMYMH
jgi:3-oxoacyl-[acyl-carrier protein] reductase